MEELIGPVEPKAFVTWQPGRSGPQGELFKTEHACSLSVDQIPPLWLQKFPRGEEIIQKAFDLRRLQSSTVDNRLEERRKCEFEIFRSVERAFWMPKISTLFNDIDTFLGLAQSILQSRKSRSGKSLELHTKQILIEENFRLNQDFEHNSTTENGKKPDFLFPSQGAYRDPSFPASKLRMLAIKTTCKDRWRQVLDEADRIHGKHLLTLQEGLSESQFNQMTHAGITLVVPQRIQKSYPQSVRPHLMSLESFLAELRVTLTN